MLGQHSNATVASIHKCIADYLKLAPHRTGGAGKGCHFQYPTAVTANANAGDCSSGTDTTADDCE